MYKIAAIFFTLFIICIDASYKQANSPAYYGFAPDYPSHQTSHHPKPYSHQLAPHESYSGPSYHPSPSYSPKPSYIYAQPSSYSSYSEPSYQPSPYSFGYKVADGYGNNQFQNEEGDDYGAKKGSYGYTDSYGIYRKVDYIADKYGFRATVSTNEPGTAPQAPADTKWYAKPAPQSYDNQPYASSYSPVSYVAPVKAYRVPSSAYYPASKYSKPY